MRIKSIRLENFGSHINTFIDFSRFNDSPIVIITGDTGSGKSTILDAITFSLYQKVPRYDTSDLKSVVSEYSQNQDSNTKTYSELVLEEEDHKSDSNPRIIKEYKIVRSIAIQNSSVEYDVELNITKKELSLEGEKILNEGIVKDSKKKKDDYIIKNIIKCDYDVFTRSVILPQGNFAMFLKSDSYEDRRKILENIFQEVKIYREISNVTKNILENKTKELDKLESNMINAVKNVESNIKTLLQEIPDAWNQIKIKIQSISLENTSELDIINLKTEVLKKYEDKINSKQKENEKLSEQRKIKEDKKDKIKQEIEKLQSLIQIYKNITEKINNAKEIILKTKLGGDIEKIFLQTDDPLFVLNHEKLDRILKDLENSQRNMTEEEDILTRLQISITNINSKYKTLADSFKMLKNIYPNIQLPGSDYLTKETLETLEKDIKYQIDKLKEEISSNQNEIDRLESLKIDEQINHLFNLQKHFNDLESLNNEILRLTENIQQKQDTNKEIHNKILELQAHREKLKENEKKYIVEKIKSSLKENDTCPVCGGIYHTSIHTETELSSQNQYKLLLENLEKINNELNKLEVEKKTNENIIKTLSENISNKTDYINKIREEIEQIKNKLQNKDISKDEDITKIKGELEQKKNEKQFLIKKKSENEKNLQKLETTYSRIYDEFIPKINELEEELSTSIASVDNAIKTKIIGKLSSTITLQNLDKTLLKETEDYKKLILSQKQLIEDLKRLIYSIQNEYTELKTISKDMKDITFDMSKLLNETHTKKKELEDLEKEIKQIDYEIKLNMDNIVNISSEKGKVEEKFKNILNQKNTYDKIIRDIRPLKEEIEILNELEAILRNNNLIDFIMKIKLEYIAENANKYLSYLGITDKQLKINYDDKGLSFNLEYINLENTRYNKRNVDSLSGGESFLFSIALSFGLVEDVIQNLKTNFIFIDEGFDTLDEGFNTRLLSFLENFAKAKNLTIYIITHKQEIAENTNYPIIEVYKENGISKVRTKVNTFELLHQ
ncbi:MAG: SMC family ATPase [Brevinematales bacterium]|nr:SMC family ATPase [Brevinematales bacterium]